MLHVCSLSITSLLSGTLSFAFCPSALHHRLTEDSDLIPGMMLSNCAETDLHNQTIKGKFGSFGKTVVLETTGMFLNNMSKLTAFSAVFSLH